MTVTLHKEPSTFMIVSRCIILRNLSVSKFQRKSNTHLNFNTFFSENCLVYEIMWESTVKPERPHIVLRRTRLACCINQDTKKHSEYVIIIAIQRQQWSCERASLSCHVICACFLLSQFSLFVAVATAKIFSILWLQVSRDTNNKSKFCIQI